MKPSEKRALEAEKRIQKEAEDREKSLQKQLEQTEKLAHQIDGEREGIDNQDEQKTCSAKIADDHKYVRKEGFVQSHVRLITFIICTVLFLTVLGPWGIDMLVSSQRPKQTNDKKDISLEAVYYISENPGEISWNSFNKFNYTDYSRDDGKYYIREYPVSGTELDLYVKVGGADLGKSPDYIYLISYDHSDYVNILKESAQGFVEKLQNE